MKTAEDIIISKRFFELTASEKEAVKEYASTEEDYEAMRWFLISTGKEFAAEKITPSSQLRRGVMAHLNQKQTAPRTFFLNGVGAFLFPSEKKFFQYPAFQMVAVAAVFVTIVLVYNNHSPLQPDLALNNHTTISDPHTDEPVEDVLTQPDQLNQAQQAEGKDLEKIEKQPIETNLAESPITITDEYYYREMAVAEEVKIAELDELESLAADDVTLSDYSNLGSGTVASQDIKTTVDSDKKDGVLKKNEGDSEKTNKSGLSRSESPVRDGVDNSGVTFPAGYVTTSTEATSGNIKEKEEYKTATAGGVFGDTASEFSADEEEVSSKLNITETKILKKLFFIVK